MSVFIAVGSSKWDQRGFDEALVEYAKVSSRSFQQIVNTKAFMVARQAFWFTPRADTLAVRQQLGGVGIYPRLTKKGKLVHSRRLQLTSDVYDIRSRKPVPLAALILNKRRGLAGEKGFYGRDMTMAAKKMIGARMASLGFLRSGWLPAIHLLAPLSDIKTKQPGRDAARRIGAAKGAAIPAQVGFRPQATIVNNAATHHDYKEAWRKYGAPALEQAFEAERLSMRQYMEDKMKPDADRFNERQA